MKRRHAKKRKPVRKLSKAQYEKYQADVLQRGARTLMAMQLGRVLLDSILPAKESE